jgi:hypothetical protein
MPGVLVVPLIGIVAIICVLTDYLKRKYCQQLFYCIYFICLYCDEEKENVTIVNGELLMVNFLGK